MKKVKERIARDNDGWLYYPETDLKKDEFCPKCEKQGEVLEYGECDDGMITSDAQCEKCKIHWTFLGNDLAQIGEFPIVTVDCGYLSYVREKANFVSVSHYKKHMKVAVGEVGYSAACLDESERARYVLVKNGEKADLRMVTPVEFERELSGKK